jgi:hypothetical protein
LNGKKKEQHRRLFFARRLLVPPKKPKNLPNEKDVLGKKDSEEVKNTKHNEGSTPEELQVVRLQHELFAKKELLSVEIPRFY